MQSPFASGDRTWSFIPCVLNLLTWFPINPAYFQGSKLRHMVRRAARSTRATGFNADSNIEVFFVFQLSSSSKVGPHTETGSLDLALRGNQQIPIRIPQLYPSIDQIIAIVIVGCGKEDVKISLRGRAREGDDDDENGSKTGPGVYLPLTPDRTSPTRDWIKRLGAGVFISRAGKILWTFLRSLFISAKCGSGPGGSGRRCYFGKAEGGGWVIDRSHDVVGGLTHSDLEAGNWEGRGRTGRVGNEGKAETTTVRGWLGG
ncbi:hypothetical protein C8F01DRAFT_1082291 [Mycena amicta]|nr:hypothetical protein C8F01DRAFT_1082291 [Mycena amicta]